jgi:hypothetical protein
MKLSKPLSASILIASALFLSGANASAVSANPRPNKHQEAADKKTQTAKPLQPEPSIPLRDFEAAQSATLDALRALHSEQEARAKEKHPSHEPIYAPANLISIGLLIVGIVYSRFAYKQWVAIKEQADIASKILKRDRPQIIVEAEQFSNFVPLSEVKGAGMAAAFFQIRNAGNQHAIILNAVAEAATFVEKEFPAIGDYSRCRSLFIRKSVLRPDEIEAQNMTYSDGFLQDEDFKGIKLYNRRLVLYGLIRYGNSLGDEFFRRFFFRFQPPGGGIETGFFYPSPEDAERNKGN